MNLTDLGFHKVAKLPTLAALKAMPSAQRVQRLKNISRAGKNLGNRVKADDPRLKRIVRGSDGTKKTQRHNLAEKIDAARNRHDFRIAGEARRQGSRGDLAAPFNNTGRRLTDGMAGY